MADQSPQQPPEKESPSPSKSATTPTKGDKTLKRKLFPSGTPEDADKKTPKVTPKRKKTTSQPGSPTLLGTPGRSIPLSERQQLALLMQMTAEESPTPGPAKESPVAKPTGSKSKVNNQNNRGETSLHLAAIKGDIQVAESLISQGADVNAQDYAGWTALHEACNHGHSELTDLLLTAGAFVNALGSDDYTPLHDAAVNGHREVVQILLKHGANPMIYNKNGKTPLDLASSSEIRNLMLGGLSDRGIEVSGTDLKGRTTPEGLVLDERATTEKKKEPTTETEAAAEIIKENTPAPSSEDPYEFTQDNSNEQKITIHWASPDKTGKNSYMEITRTIPKAREQSTPVSFSSSSTSDSDLLDPQLNPIMTKALDDIKGESPIKPIPQETSPVSLSAKLPGSTSGPLAPAPGETPVGVKEDREEEKPLFIVEDVKPVEAETKPTETTISGDKVDVKEMGAEKRVDEKHEEQPKDAMAVQDAQHISYTIPKVGGKEILPEADDNSQEPNLKLTITRLSQDSDLVCEPSEKKPDPPKRISPLTVIPPTLPVPVVAEVPILQTGAAVKRPPVCETVTQTDDKKRQSPSSQIRLQVVSTQEQGSSSDSDSIREWRILQPPPETAGVATETTEGDVTMLEKQPQVKEKTKKHRDRSQKSHKKHKHSHSHPHSTKEEPAEVPMEVAPVVPPAVPPVIESQRESPSPSKKPEEGGGDGKDPLAREYYIVQQKQSSSGEIKKLLLRTSLPVQITSSNDEKGIPGKVIPEPDSTEAAVATLGATGVLQKPLDGAAVEGVSGPSRGSPTVTSSDQVLAETPEGKESKERAAAERADKPNEFMKSETTTADGRPQQKVTRTLRSNSNLQNVSLHNPDEKEKEKESSLSQPMTRSRRNQLEAAASAGSSNQTQEQVMDSHPRKRKIAKHRQQQQEELQVPAPPPQVPLHEQANSMEQFLNVRREMRKRQRANLLPVTPNMPNRFEEYLMHRKTYLLHRDPQAKINLAVPKMTPPEDLNPVLKENFDAQENKRHSLRLRHQIEREKLMLAAEQEVLRVYGRGARAMVNQTTPFSACMVLNDMEVYNMPDPLVSPYDHTKTISQQEENKGNSRQRFNGRHFHSWLHDVDEKYEKIKEDLLKRHQHEAMSLYAVQKLEWEVKLQETKMWDKKKPQNISRHVPMVEIDRDFDLLPKS
ncbi:uncharacterized protein [Apostichopus japonicus]|uniref:uncharacterized protein isoform X2 n=1 Tax=Stichopus japonicus TaxID=307972 RepID=UPI003AB719F9